MWEPLEVLIITGDIIERTCLPKFITRRYNWGGSLENDLSLKFLWWWESLSPLQLNKVFFGQHLVKDSCEDLCHFCLVCFVAVVLNGNNYGKIWRRKCIFLQEKGYDKNYFYTTSFLQKRPHKLYYTLNTWAQSGGGLTFKLSISMTTVRTSKHSKQCH